MRPYRGKYLVKMIIFEGPPARQEMVIKHLQKGGLPEDTEGAGC
jgi:hypothetical protein